MAKRKLKTEPHIELLVPERLTYWCELVGIPAGALMALQAMAAHVLADQALSAAFQKFHEKTAVRGEWNREWTPLPMDPEVVERCGEGASLYYLLAYLSALPSVWSRYERQGIGMDVFKATMLDFRFYIQDFYDLNGRWGFATFGWIWRHLAVELFRIGRLQYMLMPFPGGVRAFRRKTDAAGAGPNRSLVLLADPDMALRDDGYAWGAGRPNGSEVPPEDERAWRPSFEAAPDGWRGHPVSPQGWVERSPLWLSAEEWELVLEPGDTVLDLHIPRKDTLTAETCGASYAQALDFFGRVFPDRPPRALYCHTWIFTPQLVQFLPETSNLVNFQREFYLYPHAGTAAYLWSFVFGASQDFETAPRNTSLRRAVLDWLAGGGEIFDLPGLMFHLPDEWGTQPYFTIRCKPGEASAVSS